MDGVTFFLGIGLIFLFAFMLLAYYWNWKYTNLMKWVERELAQAKRPSEEVFTEGFQAGREYEQRVKDRSRQ